MNIKEIELDKIKRDWDDIKKLSITELEEINERSKVGCDIIDYYFFDHRLKTIGNKGINFYEFVENIEYYKTKKYIQTLLSYCEKNNRYKDSLIKRYYYIYGLSFGRINAFKITNALKIYHTYKPTCILDPFCGFGGRMAAAMMQNIKYIGVDINIDLKPDYERMISDFSNNKNDNNCNYELYFQDCLSIDYSKLNYDMVFTSPPYENIEIYPNNPKRTPKEWREFYKKIFKLLWDNLKSGTFIININEKIYTTILVPLIGECHIKLLLKKAKRNAYIEFIYVWMKTI
jgi:hypothetical protein